MKSGWLVSCGFLVLAFTMTGAPHAQDQAGAGELEQVVVTAQKREQDLQKVPSSVAAVSDEKLDVMTSGGLDVRLLSARVPSLYIESSFGRTFPRFYIRGLGNTDFDLNASQPVSLVYDEVVLENPILKGFPIFDVDRIEVLRGPQGTLFGRNTPAGIVKFESRKPTHETGGYGRLSYGRFDSFQFEGALNGPLVEDVLAGRVSGLYQGRGDWVDNTLTPQSRRLGGYDEFAVRAQLLYTPNDKFSALLNGHARELDGTARLFQSNMVDSGSVDIVSDFERDEIAIDGANKQKLQTRGAIANLKYDFGTTTLTSVTGYENAELFSRGDIDGGFGDIFNPPSGPRRDIPFSSETADAVPSLHQFTEEIRLASNGWERGNFTAGGFYFFENLDVESFSYHTPSGGGQNGFATQRQEARAWALFGAVDVNVTDELTASGGIRYSDDQKDFSAERTQTPIGFLGVPDSTGLITADLSADFVSWDGSLSFAVNPDVNVYGRVARSFRAPSVQGRLLFGDPAVFDSISTGDTEKILSYEGGVKANLLDNRARANISGFYYQMDDQQLTAVGGAGNFNTLLNADKSTGAGFELDLEFLPVNQIFFTAGLSYNKTEIDDTDLTTAIPLGADPRPTVLDTFVVQDTTVSIHKNSFPNAPEWVFNATLRAATPVGSDGEAFFYTDWAYRSEVNFFLYESVEFRDKHLVEGGVRVGYSRFDRSYEVAVFGRNITNDLSRTGGIDFNNLTGFVNEPATWGVEVRRAF
jgi:iron complex outermembrane receptor protein